MNPLDVVAGIVPSPKSQLKELKLPPATVNVTCCPTTAVDGDALSDPPLGWPKANATATPTPMTATPAAAASASAVDSLTIVIPLGEPRGFLLSRLAEYLNDTGLQSP